MKIRQLKLREQNVIVAPVILLQCTWNFISSLCLIACDNIRLRRARGNGCFRSLCASLCGFMKLFLKNILNNNTNRVLFLEQALVVFFGFKLLYEPITWITSNFEQFNPYLKYPEDHVLCSRRAHERCFNLSGDVVAPILGHLAKVYFLFLFTLPMMPCFIEISSCSASCCCYFYNTDVFWNIWQSFQCV